MELGKYLKPKSQRQLDVKSKTASLKSKSDAKTEKRPQQKPLLDPFGVPSMGWMPRNKIMSVMANRDAELRAKAGLD